MRFLITGACGFVGPYLSRRLAEDSTADILCLDLREDPSIKGRSVRCDVLDFDTLQQIVNGFQPDRVVHLAGLVHPAESQQRARDYYLVNVQGTVNLLEAVRLKCPTARILVVSSAEVYGACQEDAAISEESLPKPLNNYGLSKLMAEQVALEYRRQYGIRTVIARPFNHSGPGQSDRFVISDFCRQVADAESKPSGGATIQVGNLAAERDFLDVRDVVDAYAKLLDGGADGETYNICRGTGTTIQTILDAAVRHARVAVKVEVSREKFRPVAFPRLIGDNRKLRGAIDWRPSHDLDETIVDTLDHWRKSLSHVSAAPAI